MVVIIRKQQRARTILPARTPSLVIWCKLSCLCEVQCLFGLHAIHRGTPSFVARGCDGINSKLRWSIRVRRSRKHLARMRRVLAAVARSTRSASAWSIIIESLQVNVEEHKGRPSIIPVLEFWIHVNKPRNLTWCVELLHYLIYNQSKINYSRYIANL